MSEDIKMLEESAKDISAEPEKELSAKEIKALIREQVSKRNMITQLVPLKDEQGNEMEIKKIYHDKKFSSPKYGDRVSYWRKLNMLAKPTSKRSAAKYAQPVVEDLTQSIDNQISE
jgi:hypothetical protein